MLASVKSLVQRLNERDHLKLSVEGEQRFHVEVAVVEVEAQQHNGQQAHQLHDFSQAFFVFHWSGRLG